MVARFNSLYQWSKKALLLLSFTVLLALGCLTLWPTPTPALVRETLEKPGQMLYQSRQSLRDEQGQTWQVVLFKRIKTDGSPEANLRLVGFPGTVSFQHPGSLLVSPNIGESFALADILVEENPGENVGQFVMPLDFVDQEINGIWVLDLPLKGEKRQIKLPYFVLQEWKTVLEKS